MYKKALFIILLLNFNLNVFSQKGKLETGKESLKTTNSSSSNGSSSSSSTSSESTSNSSLFDDDTNFFVKILGYLVAYTVYGLAVELPTEVGGRMHDAEISNYPYKNSKYGNFIYTDSTNYNSTRFDITNNFVIEKGNLYGNNFDANFRFLKRFGFAVDYLYLTEKVNGKTDSFSLYTGLLKYYRIRTQRFDAWYGLGIMYVGSDVNTSGFALGFGAEIFIAKPISLDFSHKLGYINKATVNKTKLLLKYHLKNYHISSGYEHFKIGVSKINTFSIGFGASF